MIESDIFDPVKTDLEAFQERYVLSPELWGKFRTDDLNGLDYSNWKTAKLIENGDISDETLLIPDDFGGIYVYCIEPRVIPNCGCYVMYIGKATKTRSENLRSRVRSYRKQLGKTYNRDRLHRLFIKWGDYVYVHYLSIDASGETITALEDRLIAAYGLPPCNAEVRVPSIKAAVKAFR